MCKVTLLEINFIEIEIEIETYSSTVVSIFVLSFVAQITKNETHFGRDSLSIFSKRQSANRSWGKNKESPKKRESKNLPLKSNIPNGILG